MLCMCHHEPRSCNVAKDISEVQWVYPPSHVTSCHWNAVLACHQPQNSCFSRCHWANPQQVQHRCYNESSTRCPIFHWCVNGATGNGPIIGIKLLRWIQSQSCSAQGWWPALKLESCQVAKNEYAQQLQVLVCLGCQSWNQAAPPQTKKEPASYCNALINHKISIALQSIGILWQPSHHSHLFEGRARSPNPPRVCCDLSRTRLRSLFMQDERIMIFNYSCCVYKCLL